MGSSHDAIICEIHSLPAVFCVVSFTAVWTLSISYRPSTSLLEGLLFNNLFAVVNMHPASAPPPYTEVETKHTPQAEMQTVTDVPPYPTVSDVRCPSSPQFPLGSTGEATGNTSTEMQTVTDVPPYPTMSDVRCPSSPQFPLGLTGEATGNTSVAPQPPPVVLRVQLPLCGPTPMRLDCPFCHEHVTTNTKRTAGALPWILCLPLFGPMPMKLDCPFCHEHVTTNTKRTAGALPWILCGMCFLLGLISFIPLFLCCIPFCMGSCMDVIHACPSCKRVLGRFSRMRIGDVGN
uniref:LITAF domain-containing protein n=1 Tax=Steinernema glaseri TaxID=37863 RepID=A0A1I7ZG03_9BILA